MIYIEKTDFEQIIRLDVLDNLTGGDDTKLDEEESYAMANVESHFGERFDLEAEYLFTGDDRNKMLVRTILHLMLYTLYGIRSTKDIPEHIEDKHGRALQYLKDVRDGKLSTNLTLKDAEVGRQAMFLGSGTKYSKAF